jgi:heme A synthase
MTNTVFKVLGYALVAVHIFLAGWSVGGFIELLTPKVPWKPFSNPEFPKWVLLFHWGTILFAAGIFLFGYFTRWKLTPHVMVVAYGLMAVVCVVETFGFMTSKYKYIAMALEYIAYIAILLLLFGASFTSLHFKK